MGKNIYEMLNDVKINEDEYEKMELTEFDKAQKQKRILKTVSYTHLDVYKRQLLYNVYQPCDSWRDAGNGILRGSDRAVF